MSIKRRSFRALISATLALFTVNGALALTPQHYASGRQLTVQDGAALGVYTLPLDVLAAVNGDLAQVAVFNGQGDVVPYAFFVPVGEHRSVHTQSLPLFPIGRSPDKPGATTTVAVTTQRDGSLARVYVAARNDATPGAFADEAATNVVGRYLIDASSIKGSIEALSFVVRSRSGDPIDFTWTLDLAAGPSLDHLTDTTYTGTLAKLTHQGTSLEVASIKTPGLAAPYVAITWRDDAPGVIERVDATVTRERVAVVPQTKELAATRIALQEPARAPINAATSPFVLLYDVQAVLPLETVQLRLNETNTLAQVQVHVSSEQPQGAALGALVYSGNVYRLSHDGALVESAPIAVSRSGRYITVTANQTASAAQLGLNADRAEAWPRLVLAYTPTQMVFVASGQAPFTLAYGSYQPSQALPPTELSAIGVSVDAARSKGDNVTAGESRRLGSPTAPREPWPWKSIGLWSVLIAGVVVLVVMTRNLLR
jgi:hypothetical protein